jgi:hypothetical protein
VGVAVAVAVVAVVAVGGGPAFVAHSVGRRRAVSADAPKQRPIVARPAERNGKEMVLKIVIAKPPTMTDANRLGKGVSERLCSDIFTALVQINTASSGSLEKFWAMQDLLLVPSQILAIGAPPAAESVFVAAQKRRMAAQRADSGWDTIEKPEVKITVQHAGPEQVMQKVLSARGI